MFEFLNKTLCCESRVQWYLDKWGMWEGGESKRRGGRGNRSHEVRIQCLHPRGSSWAGRAAGGVKTEEEKKNIKRRLWTLTFLPSRKLRAVPMLATQWILFSFLPCSHGWKEKGENNGERWKGRNKETDSVDKIKQCYWKENHLF